MTREEIERMEAGREMDALVAEKIMEHPGEWIHWDENGIEFDTGIGRMRIRACLNYSADISAALEVAEKFDNFSIARAWKLNIGEKDWRGYSAWLASGPEAVSALAETIPLAICRAAMMLKG